MNKVGLMTCFLDNYGACLQAYALSTVIESFGYDCEILQYIEPQGYIEPSFGNRIKNTFIYNKLRSVSRSYKNSYLCEILKENLFRSLEKRI